MRKIKQPSISGTFYSANAEELKNQISNFAKESKNTYVVSARAVIVPHAGLIYSGRLAYEGISQLDKNIKNLFIFAPAHRVGFEGCVLTGFEVWQTPLGEIEINNDINKDLQDNFGLKINDDAFAPEHAVEIQVPVIQSVFKDVKIIPVLVGKSSPEMVENIINHYYPDKTNGFIISSDLSHFLKDEEAKKLDNLTAQMIESGACSGFRYEQACGAVGIIGLVEFARKNDFSLIRIDMTNSSAVTGDTSSVVGYGCWFLYEGKKNDFLKKYYSEFILNLCRLSINSRFDRREMKVRIPYVFYQPRACFVTLEKNNILRGCIGSIIAHRPLIEDLILNAKSAAFQDPRFKPVEIEEVLELDVAVSLLSEPQIMSFESEEDLLNQIVPFKDGIIIKDGNYQAVYLPSVWEQIPDKKGFLNSLKIKAGLPSNYFSKTFQAYRFETDYIK